jgi:(1->4)-alpha-D-glucan 1-alpha-D-glucosylmutase
LNVLGGVFVDADNARAFNRMYQKMRDTTESFDDLVYRAKKLILQSAMSSELYVLARRLDRISEQHRWSRDFTMNSLHDALAEVIASFPVYRTYVQVDTVEVSVSDRQHILTAIRAAKRRNRNISESIFDFIGDILMLQDPEGLTDADHFERRDFVMRLQQLTGPVMAKGLEDTAFYRFFPLTSLNEVGGHPGVFGVGIDKFHAWNRARLAQWPHALSATATHDTKRGEDVRARLNVLSEIPREWQMAVRRWQRLNRHRKPKVDEAPAPGTNEEYFIYQTLVGALPFSPTNADTRADAHSAFVDRMSAYVNKALKESKLYTSWINVNEAYEQGVDEFLRAILSDKPSNGFLRDLQDFSGEVARHGISNALSQMILKITAPGVPDFYQGTELWDLSLVDPDNRRPVDYKSRRALLDQLAAGAEQDPDGQMRTLFAAPFDGAIKLALMQRALHHRRRHRRLFESGDYVPLTADGERRRNVISFARVHEDKAAVVVAGRFFASIAPAGVAPTGAEAWGSSRLILDGALPAGRYRDVFTGRDLTIHGEAPGLIPLAAIFATLPVALLERVS